VLFRVQIVGLNCM